MSSAIDKFLSSNGHQRLADLWQPLLAHLWGEALEEIRLDLISLQPENCKIVVEACSSNINPGLSDSQFETVKRVVAACVDRGVDPISELAQLIQRVDPLSSVIKNPTKTNPYEEVAAKYLRLKLSEESFPVVRQTNSLRTQIRFNDSGDVKIGPGRSQSYSKSVDLLVIEKRGEKLVVYMLSHKFARVAGGHQDNQANDVEEYLRNSSKAFLRPEVLEALYLELVRVCPSVLEGHDLNTIDFVAGAALDGEYFAERNFEHPGGTLIGSTDRILEIFLSA